MLARSCLAVVACLGLSLVAPRAVAAQGLPPAPAACPCPATSPLCTCTTLQPVVETRMRAEPALTIVPEPRLGYRPEARLTNVPVTTFRNVTVDEGHYQTVWIPRPVTRQIAETAWQPQLSVRSVPFVYTEPVAQLSSRLVPEQTVRYVPRTQVVLGGPLYVPRTLAVVPVVSPLAAAAFPAPLAAPIPDPAFAQTAPAPPGADWRTISSRSSHTPAWPASIVNGVNGMEEYDVLPVQALAPGNSVKAPSAAIVWQTPGSRR
jgi:hypothetical protein